MLGSSARRFCGVAAVLAFLGSPPDHVGADPSDVLAKVGDLNITRAEFDEFKVPIVSITYEGAQTDSALLRSLVDRTVLVMEAESLGIDEEPGLVDALELFKKARIIKDYKTAEINRKVAVSEEEMLEQFHASERDRALRVAGILVQTKKEAAEVLEALEAGGDFAQLARDRSLYESAEQGGDTGKFFFKDNTSPALKDHIFKMAVGDVSEPLPFFGRWTVIKILDEVPVDVAQVEEAVFGEVMQRKRKERTDVLIDSLYKIYAPVKMETTIEELKERFSGSVEDSTRLDDQVLCSYKGGQLTFRDFREVASGAARDFLGKLDPWGDDFTEEDKIDSLVHEALPWRLMLEEGLSRGLANDPEIEAAVENERASLLVSRVHEWAVESRVPDVTLQEARSFYEQHPEKFQTIHTIVITEIIVRFEQLAIELRKQIDAGADPAEIAVEHTIREGADHHKGRLELTPYKEVRLPGRWDIVKDMEIGEVAGPVEVADGWTILSVLEKSPAVTKPFNASTQRRAKAYVNIHRSRLQYVAFVQALHDKFGVEILAQSL